MQQDHPALHVDVEQHPSDSILTQTRPDFIKSVAQRSTNRHPNRPTEFHSLDVYTDLLPIFDRAERLQPIAYRLPARTSPKEDRLYSFQARRLDWTAHLPE